MSGVFHWIGMVVMLAGAADLLLLTIWAIGKRRDCAVPAFIPPSRFGAELLAGAGGWILISASDHGEVSIGWASIGVVLVGLGLLLVVSREPAR